MKKLFALLAVVLTVVSCQKDADLDVNVGGEQLVNITVALPEATRATSADSGWDNTNATLRVIFQVYDEKGNTNKDLRQEKTLEYGQGAVNFDVRLVPGRDYTFVAWADQGKGYFNVDDLTKVTFVKDSWRAMDEVRDAYTATQLIPAGQSIPNVTLTLTRPFAKVRVVTTDMDAINDLKLEVNNAVVEYSVALPNAFNAYSGEVVEGALQNNVKHTYKYSYNYVYKYNENENEKTLFADYILVPANDVVKFTLKVYDTEKLIRENTFSTDIPVERNKLTTIKGNILTDGSGIKVEVKDEFQEPGNNIEVVEVATADALIAALNTPNAEVVLTQDIEYNEKLTIKNTATIDLNGNMLKTSAPRFIRIQNDGTNPMSVNIKNGEIINNTKGGRCVETRSGNINLTLDGVKMTSYGYKDSDNYAQPFTVGGSGNNINVTIKNSYIDTDYYAIMTFNPAVITLDNTVLNGYTTVYFKPATGSLGSNGTIFNVTNNSVINSVNNSAGETNASSAFQFADTGVSVNIDASSTITAAANKNYQHFFAIGNEVDNAEVCTATVRIDDGATLTATGKDEYKGFLNIYAQPALPKFSANMATTLTGEGWAVSEPVDGLVTVLGKGVAANTTNDLNAAVKNANATVYVGAGEYAFPTSVATSVAAGVTIKCAEGTVFTGQSSLTINGATVEGATFSNPGGSAVKGTVNGTFKNCKFEGGNGLRECYAGETVVFEDCVFSGSTYGAHFDGGANDIIFRNCTFSGFNTFGAQVTLLTLEGCTFVGNGKSGYNGVNLWGSTTLKDCEFTFDGTTANEWVDCRDDGTASFTNCTVNGEPLTVENISNLTSDTSAFTLYDANNRIILHSNAQYTYAENSVDVTAFKDGAVVYRGILSEGKAGNISSINVDEGIVRLNNRCFCKDTNLVNVALPNTLTYIDEGVFQQSGFKSITIPENVTFIGKQAFGACGELETIVINAKKVTIDNFVARGCAKLKSVYIYSEEIEFINKSMYFTNKENADASAITFYVSSQDVANTVYEAQSTSHSYGIKIVSIDGATTYYNTLK